MLSIYVMPPLQRCWFQPTKQETYPCIISICFHCIVRWVLICRPPVVHHYSCHFDASSFDRRFSNRFFCLLWSFDASSKTFSFLFFSLRLTNHLTVFNNLTFSFAQFHTEILQKKCFTLRWHFGIECTAFYFVFLYFHHVEVGRSARLLERLESN